MKKSQVLTLICLLFLAVASIIFYFEPDDKSDLSIATTKSTAKPSIKSISNSSQTTPARDVLTQEENTPNSNNYTQNIPTKMRFFVEKVESILTGVQGRESKIISLMDMLHNAESDEEKIAILQSLSTLKPIEYVDDLISLSQSNQESNKVRAEALNTLNKTYLLTDEEVEKIGGSTVYSQMEKTKQYVNSVVNDKDNNPPELYITALQGYVYMESDKALELSMDIIEESDNLTEVESDFFIETMFVDSRNLTTLLPILQQHPKKVTDSMASQLAVMSADPIILEGLSQAQKQQVLAILKSHELDLNNPMYQVELDTINVKIKEIEDSL